MAEQNNEEERQEEELAEPEAARPEPPEEPAEQDGSPEEPEPEEAGLEALSRALKGSFLVLKVAMIVLVAFYLLTGVFYVEPQEIRFKLRFGRLVPSRGDILLRPGKMYIKWPWESLKQISAEERILDMHEAFWTRWPGSGESKKDSLNVHSDGYVITGDVNIAHLAMRVRYRVEDDVEAASAYGFGVAEPEELLRRMARRAVLKVVGTMDVMSVLEREGLFLRITEELRKRVERFEQTAGLPLGVEVVSVEAVETKHVKNPTEPRAVKRAFFEAQDAASEADRMISQAESEKNAIVERARARRDEIMARAQGYRARFVSGAEADAEALQELLPLYRRSPEEADILRETFYERALQQVMDSASAAFVLYRPTGGSNRQLRLMLAREAPLHRKPKQEQK